MISRDPVDFSENFPQNRNCPTFLIALYMEINWDKVGNHRASSSAVFEVEACFQRYKTSHTFDGMGSEHIGTSTIITIYCINIYIYSYILLISLDKNGGWYRDLLGIT